MLSSSWQQLEKQGAQRVNSEPSLNRFAVTTATMDNRPNLVVAQPRPIPKAGLSLSSKRGDGASASKASTVNKVVSVDSGGKDKGLQKKKKYRFLYQKTLRSSKGWLQKRVSIS